MKDKTEQFAPKFDITPLMLRQLMAIARTRGFLEAVRTRPAWVDRLRADVRVKDVLSSVQIEGNTLTREQAFELARAEPPVELRDSEREFLNYLHAFDALEMLRGERDYPVQARDLRSLHGSLVQGVRGGDRFAGQFRKEEVKIGDKQGDDVVVHHKPPLWHEVEQHVQHLLEWIRHVTRKPRRAQVMAGELDPWIHPVIIAGIAQHRLVWIHPFVDGNGRTARLFTTMLLYMRGYDFKYLFDLSSYYNHNRDAYYASLRTVDRTDDYTRWLIYFMGGFAKQMYNIRQQALGCAVGEQPDEEGHQAKDE